MARIEKYTTGIVGVVKHNIREYKTDYCPTNEELDFSKSNENYSLIRRGDTAKEIERYRKSIEKEIFSYNRKNLVHAVEVVTTLPADCPKEQEKDFFNETLNYISSTLPMGERCIFLAEVHADEGKITKNGQFMYEGQKHLHVMYVPAAYDTKHEGYEYRLCADELTKRPILKNWHKNYQKWIDDAGIHATVSSGVTTASGISVKALKELTKATGYTFDQIMDLSKTNEYLQSKVHELDALLTMSNDNLAKANETIKELEQELEKSRTIDTNHDNTWGNNSWGQSSWVTKDIEHLR